MEEHEKWKSMETLSRTWKLDRQIWRWWNWQHGANIGGIQSCYASKMILSSIDDISGIELNKYLSAFCTTYHLVRFIKQFASVFNQLFFSNLEIYDDNNRMIPIAPGWDVWPSWIFKETAKCSSEPKTSIFKRYLEHPSLLEEVKSVKFFQYEKWRPLVLYVSFISNFSFISR